MKLILITISATLLAQEPAKQAPGVTDADKAFYYQQAAILARIESQQQQLAQLAEAARSKLSTLFKAKEAAGCQLQETAAEGLACIKKDVSAEKGESSRK